MSNETDWISLELIERDRQVECGKSAESTIEWVEERKKKQGYHTNFSITKKTRLSSTNFPTKFQSKLFQWLFKKWTENHRMKSLGCQEVLTGPSAKSLKLSSSALCFHWILVYTVYTVQ